MRAVLAWALATAACGAQVDHATDAPPSTVFDLHQWVWWDRQYSPDVLSVTVDGHDVPSNTTWEDEQWFTSYDAALAQYRPSHVAITTTTGVLARDIGFGDCEQELAYRCTLASSDQRAPCPAPVVSDAIQWIVDERPFLQFYVYEDSCADILGRTSTRIAR